MVSGFGDFVPGSSIDAQAESGQAKLILSCIYVLMGLAFFSMTINLVQEEIVDKIRQLAKDIGIINDDDEDSICEESENVEGDCDQKQF